MPQKHSKTSAFSSISLPEVKTQQKPVLFQQFRFQKSKNIKNKCFFNNFASIIQQHNKNQCFFNNFASRFQKSNKNIFFFNITTNTYQKPQEKQGFRAPMFQKHNKTNAFLVPCLRNTIKPMLFGPYASNTQ